MYGVRPPGGGAVIGVGGLAATGLSTGVYLLVGLAAVMAGLLILRAARIRRRGREGA